VIRRAPQQGESSQARTKIALRTSSAEKLNYLLADVLEEHRLAREALECKMSHDCEDLKIAYQLARQEANEAKSRNPLLCQVSAMEKIEKDKTEYLKFYKEKLNFRKYKSKIITCSISGQCATKQTPANAILKETRADWTFTTHSHTRLDVFGYYEWLEIIEVIRNEKSAYKKLIEQELNSLISRISKVIKVPPKKKIGDC